MCVCARPAVNHPGPISSSAERWYIYSVGGSVLCGAFKANLVVTVTSPGAHWLVYIPERALPTCALAHACIIHTLKCEERVEQQQRLDLMRKDVCNK